MSYTGGSAAVWERRHGKYGQPDEWFSCLTAVKLPRIGSANDEADETGT